MAPAELMPQGQATHEPGTHVRTLVLVLAAHAWPYPILLYGIRRTWASVDVDGVTTLFYYGGKSHSLRGRRLTVPASDALPAGEKTVASFEYVLAAYDFDILFRSSCSTYVDLPNMQAFLRSDGIPGPRFYRGLTSIHEGVLFAAGSGYFLSRDLVQLVVEQQDQWNHSLPDDVALADLLGRNGIQPASLIRIDYRSARDIHDVDTTQFYFRCKTHSPWRIGDLRAMLKLHQSFCQSRGETARSLLLQVTTAGGKIYSVCLTTRWHLRQIIRRIVP
jgi:hypothetical protein